MSERHADKIVQPRHENHPLIHSEVPNIQQITIIIQKIHTPVLHPEFNL